MAKDQTTKRQTLAKDMCANASALIAALNNLVDDTSEYTASGLLFQDSDFGILGLMHLDANTMAVLMNSVNAMNTAMVSNGWTAALDTVIP